MWGIVFFASSQQTLFLYTTSSDRDYQSCIIQQMIRFHNIEIPVCVLKKYRENAESYILFA